MLGNVNAGSTTLSVVSPGAYQTTYGGGTVDGFLVKFDGCRGIIPPADSTLLTCSGTGATLTAVQSCTTNWYNNSTGGSLLAVGSLYTSTLTFNSTYYAEDAGCGPGLPRTAVTVTVIPPPSISVSRLPQVFCAGQTITLTASGASSYTWVFFPPVTGTSATMTPVFSSTYAVSGTDANGCEGQFVFAVVADPCNGIDEKEDHKMSVVIYPNPNEGEFTVQSENGFEWLLYNSAGQIVFRGSAEPKKSTSIDDLSKGLYFLSIKSDTGYVTKKIVVR
jgi:hypothetical protein